MKQITLNVNHKKRGFEITNKEDNNIHSWQQELAEKRLNRLDNNPEKAVDFNELINWLEKKHEL